MSEIPEQPSQTIIAKAGSYYRNTRYLMTVLLIGMGLWFGYDGFINYPKINQTYDTLEQQKIDAKNNNDTTKYQQLVEQQHPLTKHTETDITLQKVLCFALPVLGVLVLLRALHNSRGEYRLEGTTLHVPGHPPVSFANITEIDRGLWDRKGIAYVQYDLGDGRQGKLRLDDFVYDRPPTDEIFKRIEQYVTPAAQRQGTSESGSVEQ